MLGGRALVTLAQVFRLLQKKLVGLQPRKMVNKVTPGSPQPLDSLFLQLPLHLRELKGPHLSAAHSRVWLLPLKYFSFSSRVEIRVLKKSAATGEEPVKELIHARDTAWVSVLPGQVSSEPLREGRPPSRSTGLTTPVFLFLLI